MTNLNDMCRNDYSPADETVFIDAISNILDRLSTLPDRKTRAKLAEKREHKQIVGTAMRSVGIALKI